MVKVKTTKNSCLAIVLMLAMACSPEFKGTNVVNYQEMEYLCGERLEAEINSGYEPLPSPATEDVDTFGDVERIARQYSFFSDSSLSEWDDQGARYLFVDPPASIVVTGLNAGCGIKLNAQWLSIQPLKIQYLPDIMTGFRPHNSIGRFIERRPSTDRYIWNNGLVVRSNFGIGAFTVNPNSADLLLVDGQVVGSSLNILGQEPTEVLIQGQ